ncbi:MAG: PAS domain S-box protein [Bacteroidia bacterium]|nr:PAS domain S-box protein [Bacteroidia bacterium]
MLDKLFGNAQNWKEKYEHENKLREQAERLLEKKAEELYLRNQEIENQSTALRNNIEELHAQEEELRQNLEELVAVQDTLVAEKNAIAAAEKRFRSLTESSADAIISINAKHIILTWNKGAEKLFGYTKEEMEGKEIMHIIPDEFKERHIQGVERFLQTRVPHILNKTVEVVGRKKEGVLFPIELTLSTWTEGDAVFFSGIIRDITQRKQNEERIRQANEELHAQEEELRQNLEELASAQDTLIAEKNAIAAAEKRFRAITETSPNAILSMNAQNIVLTWNKGAEKLFGYTKEEMEGKEIMRIIPNEYKEQHIQGVERYLKTRIPKVLNQVVEITGLKKDGTIFPIELILSTWTEGDAVFFSGIIRDITERKIAEERINKTNLELRAQEEELRQNLEELASTQDTLMAEKNAIAAAERRFRSLTESSADAIISTNAQNIVLTWNKGAEKLFGYTKEEMEGKEIMRIIPDEYKEQHIQGVERYLKTRISKILNHPGEIIGLKKDGTTFPLEIIVSTWSEGDLVFFSAIIRDITERRIAKEKLKQKNVELQAQEEELRQSVEELEASNEELLRVHHLLNETNKSLQESERNLETKVQERTQELEKANRVKSEFLANMSHELRTPMNAILGYAQILGQADDLGTKHKEKISIINKSGEHLLHLINSILDLSKIDAGRMELQPAEFDLKATLHQLYDLFRLQCEKKGIEFQFDIVGSVPNFAKADEKKLKQCLINIIGNAIKFTKAGFVKLIVTKETNETVKFLIADSGRGIPADKIAAVLEPFTQVHEHLNTEGGTGLGLAITKKFIEMMGGTLELSSTEGIGTSFWFTIPLEEVSNFETTHLSNAKIIGYQSTKPIKVLIVDDNPVNRSLVIDILSPLGFEYDLAENGIQAIDKAITYSPDIILMDIRMPGMSGIQATEVIRRMELGKIMKIIAVTANAFEQDKKEYFEKGCNGFVAKPYNPTTLLEEMRKMLNIEYLYEETTTPELNKGTASNTVEINLKEIKNHIDIQTLKEFEQALLVGKFEEMKHIITGVADTSPLITTFKIQIMELIKNFDFDTLETQWAEILNS